MNFAQALNHLKDGNKVRVPEWKGYWFLKEGKVVAHCADGKEVEATQFQVNIFRNDWSVVNEPKKQITDISVNIPLNPNNPLEPFKLTGSNVPNVDRTYPHKWEHNPYQSPVVTLNDHPLRNEVLDKLNSGSIVLS